MLAKLKQVGEKFAQAANDVMYRKDYAIGAATAAFTLGATSAKAEVAAGVLTTITTAVTDVGVIGAAILIVVVAIAAYNWLRKPVH